MPNLVAIFCETYLEGEETSQIRTGRQARWWWLKEEVGRLGQGRLLQGGMRAAKA